MHQGPPAKLQTANAQQYEAITTTDGPLLIIAGPGSGKTFTLVERIVSLLTEKNLTPEHMMVVTFTDKAAQELTTRISNRLEEIDIHINLNEMYLGTCHSICLRWLQDHREFTRLKHNFIMMDQFDQHYFLYQRFKTYEALEGIDFIAGEPDTSNWERSENVMKWVNTVSEESLDIDTLLAAPDEDVRALGRCVQLYHAQLEEANALDFPTIQREAHQLLKHYPAVRNKLREQIAYVMVDEYQDTNTIQERILHELVGTENPHLCVVGDDDQGIYRFRGASIRNILQFSDSFASHCKQVQLTTNYRSYPDIITFCNRWMQEHDWQGFRYTKYITPRDQQFPAIPTVMKVAGPSDEEWNEEVPAFLQALRTYGHLTNWNQVAFLFRSVKNDTVRALAEYLEQHGIAVYSPRANQFFDREEVRLMLGAFLFLFPQYPSIRKWQDDAHLNIWDYYDNSCFAAFCEELRKPENRELWGWARRKADEHRTLTDNTDYAFSGLFSMLLQFPLFSRYLDEEYLKAGLRESRAMHNLAIFSQMLNKFDYLNNLNLLRPDFLEKNLCDLLNQFFRFLKDGGLNEYEADDDYAPSEHVSFLTIHQSKGLEYPVVLVGSLGSVPRKQFTELTAKLEQSYYHRQPFEPIEETKYYDFYRLYYTAFSRAQNILALTASERGGSGRTPSKYFTNVYASLPSWRDPLIDLSALPLEIVKQATIKHEYAFTTDIILFENCAEQYRFYRALEFAPVRRSSIIFGTVVHQTIEDIHKTVLRGEEHKLSEDQIRTWFDTNYIQITKRERNYLDPRVRKTHE